MKLILEFIGYSIKKIDEIELCAKKYLDEDSLKITLRQTNALKSCIKNKLIK